VRSAADERAIAEFCERHGLALAGVVPWSDEVVAADRAGVPVVDWSAAREVVAAVAALSDVLSAPVSTPVG